ncbi:MAG TPA: protein kinase [Gemmatimonadaceae bacterium]|jgi:DNA-binding response OmpR family regulator
MTGLTTPAAVAELRHELRTPLNLIIGYGEMLLEDATDPDQRAYLEQTLGAGRDLLSIINAAVPPSREEISEEEFTGLQGCFREPQARILAATASLLAQASGNPDPQFERDVRRIRSSAERLLTVELPLRRSDTHPPSSITAQPSARTVATDPSARPACILVVDDQEDNRAVLERRLRRQGHTVECASGGYSALDLLSRARFDLVLLDVMMPDLDGLAVLERMKANAATRDIPVIMISALDDVASVVRCIERGAEDHLSKPFDPVLLRARISSCLEKKQLRDSELEYLGEVAKVIQAATAMEEGSYEGAILAPVAKRGDELGKLARVFDAMAEQIRVREARLRNQVDALRREIDGVRQASRDTVSDAAPSLSTGEVFAGRFEILGELGRGGMGMVYRALDRQLGDRVALKTLRPELVRDQTLVDRFKSEIRLARHISSKHVVRTHDIGERDGVYFLTMEYVEGITVRELLDTRGKLGVAPTLAIASQLAYSLVAAHDQGVIHRDIKPQNLLLDAAGVLKVMDFGVARLAGETNGLTEVGMIVGTPSYMAPEQMLGEECDARVDLYATGVVLFECLLGRVPFEAASPVALIAKVLREPPPTPAALDPEIPPPLSDLVLRLLAKEPGQRPANAEELSQILSRLS